MSFAELVKQNATFIAGHVGGETVEYWAHPHGPWVSVPARVQLNPVEPTGEVLRNSAEILLSKAAVAQVQHGVDHVKIRGVDYRVASVRFESPGSYTLLCHR